MTIYDVVVLGGGPAGTTAALRARELGASVALLERGEMGGVCTNDGCIPTRVLAKAARLVRDADQFDAYGLSGARPTVDLARVMARVQQMIGRIHEKKQIVSHLESAGVLVRANAGEARFVDAASVILPTGETFQGKTFILCIGGHARRLPIPGGEYALTHSDLWSLRALPRSMAVVGGAATGCQIASIFAAFGSHVTLLDFADRIVVGEDIHTSQALTRAFSQHGIDIVTSAEVQTLQKNEDGMHLGYSVAGELRTLDVETVVVAAGWPGNVDTLNLEAAGIETARGYISVDESLRTTAPNIYAAGDITGRMMLVQSAGDEARVAAENAVLGRNRRQPHTVVPHGSFTDPEYASVGLTEAAARNAHECAVALVPYADLDRAIVDGYRDGFFKLIVERETRQILGAHVVGEQAVEIVQLVAAAMTGGTRVEQLAELELAYPTYTGIVGLAARQISRELGVVPLSDEWRAQQAPRSSEWERSPE
ncbi:dihydrolipoyl dehydrogenase [Capsulimonas corticalis]|uniref:Dihydrolipoyl dehydrogenase n=1 Tax=Capsulimonas corticalis TaxID=2219043 RepID=A0A402CQ50_9BACT|nr:NAD(P)/FAD-dependent oxidoreductase [Capsulimonas corticalis]BDI32834.1 dihydrolipoyl dehydrogenase [Capsulimonas corticalis]